MTATQKLAAAASVVALTGVTVLQADVPVVTDVTLIQMPHTRKVQVSYKTSGPGIATCCFMESGEPVGEPGSVCSTIGAIHKSLPASGSEEPHTFIWDAGSDLPDQTFENLSVEIKLWTTNNPPEYCVVDLTGEQAAAYRVRWYGSAHSVPLGIEHSKYKKDYLLLRKIPATRGEYVNLGPNNNQRAVRITQPFYIGVYQVTQQQWVQVGSESNRSEFKLEDDWQMRPLDMVSYNDIRGSGFDWPQDGANVLPASFMGILRAKTGNILRFDLPTEAQWEYACRGPDTPPDEWNNGSDPTKLARYNTNGGEIPGGYEKSDVPADKGGTARVGTYLSNGWGLYDMHGNVEEWCLDWMSTDFSADYMKGDDPTGPTKNQTTSTKRVVRGGTWAKSVSDCTAASRHQQTPSNRAGGSGIRVVAPAVAWELSQD